jgi:hypothetical protein
MEEEPVVVVYMAVEEAVAAVLGSTSDGQMSSLRCRRRGRHVDSGEDQRLPATSGATENLKSWRHVTTTGPRRGTAAQVLSFQRRRARHLGGAGGRHSKRFWAMVVWDEMGWTLSPAKLRADKSPGPVSSPGGPVVQQVIGASVPVGRNKAVLG